MGVFVATVLFEATAFADARFTAAFFAGLAARFKGFAAFFGAAAFLLVTVFFLAMPFATGFTVFLVAAGRFGFAAGFFAAAGFDFAAAVFFAREDFGFCFAAGASGFAFARFGAAFFGAFFTAFAISCSEDPNKGRRRCTAVDNLGLGFSLLRAAWESRRSVTADQ